MEEKDFYLSDEILEILNSFIDLNISHKSKSTDYDFLYKVSEMMATRIQIGDRYIHEVDKPISLEDAKSIALSFYQDLDQELYEKVSDVVNGNSKFEFRMYPYDRNEDFSKRDENGLPIHTRGAKVQSYKGKSVIYIPCRGTIFDVYSAVHEIAHTFDFIDGDNPTRNMLGEVTPYSFQAMLKNYLLKNNIITEKEAAEIEKEEIKSRFDDGVETFAKLKFMKIKAQKGRIEQEDINKIQSDYKLHPNQLNFIINRMIHGDNNVDCRARYMIAQLIYPKYMEDYEKDPKEAIKRLKEYFTHVKENKFEESLKTLGIEPTDECVLQLIDISNKRIGNIQKQTIDRNTFEDIE